MPNKRSFCNLRPSKSLYYGTLFILLLTSSSCNSLIRGKLFKDRATETPPPSEERIEKSFFVDPSGKPKTFLCAWAPEMGRGWVGEYVTLMVNNSPHCNIEFEVTERYLVGKIVHPSFPDDRNRWQEALKIPIAKHYYYEKNKDSYGRETNEFVENSSRSHWSARPMMTLDLASIEILDFLWGGPHRTTNVEEIEWDKESNFLGFSMNIVSSLMSSEMQTKIRVNFLKFDHDQSFKRIPYHQENSKYLNILHVMGRRIEGIEPELYAARWDLRKPTKIYLNGVPAEHESTVKEVVKKWNKTFQNIGAVAPDFNAFEPVVANLKHPFDLRYPGITWISDQRISLNSPLGIGMAHADVRNGKIIWGGVVLYGGMLEKYINAYAPVTASSMENQAMSRIFPIGSVASPIPQRLESIPAVKSMDFNLRSQVIEGLSTGHRQFVGSEIERLAEQVRNKEAKNYNGKTSVQNDIENLKTQLESLKTNSSGLQRVASELILQAKNEMESTNQYFKQFSLIDQMGFGSQVKQGDIRQSFQGEEKQNIVEMLKDKNERRRLESLRLFLPRAAALFVERDRTVQNLAGPWNQSEAHGVRTHREMLDSVVMDLALHEVGHLLGLGHQFKENILPKTGTVPSRYIKELSLRANAKSGFTNMSTVMGYRNGRTEMILPASELKPQIHDELVLRYLYKGEYSVFDRSRDDFRFVQLPVSGKIPGFTEVDNGKAKVRFPVSYFPACNDYEASLGADPFCNRWDRGSQAVDIVSSYFSGISDNLIANLYSMVGGSGNEWQAESRLWWMALDTFSRVRLFYDEMRRRLRSDEALRPLWNQLKNDQEGLFEFSQACEKADPTDSEQVKNKTLRELFASDQMVDLCRANNLALKEFKFFVNLPEGDYTRVDHQNRYVSGGYLAGDASRDWGHMFGSWYQLANLPLKISSLHTLTTASPYLMLDSGFSSNPYYDNADDRYLYRTLYPREYTKLVADTVKSNLRFSATGRDDVTAMGRSVLAAGYMVPGSINYSNDSQKLPRSYNETLNQQTEFRLSMVAVLISATTPDVNSGVKADHYKKFTATIFDYFTGKSSTARDVFVLPQGNVFVRANGMFIFPITKMKFYEGSSSYVIAYKVDYDFEVGDRLLEDSVKFSMTELHDQIASICVDGFSGSGLTHYFDNSNQDFDGFYIPPGLSSETGKEKLGLFYDSIEREFSKYEEKVKGKVPSSFAQQNMRSLCDESIRGVGQILASAAIINGYWLKITPEFLVK